ncbi:MAG TPA: pilus assembly protein TadG-related protein [Tepidisphaeraceae bacterium]
MALRRANNQGMAIAYASVFLVVMLGVISLAVDWGRVQTAKTELQDAVDAAARYAATGFSTNSAVTRAQESAVQNSVDGSYFSLAAANVEQGTWNYTTREFAVSATNKTAVRVIGQRTVPLLFGTTLGLNAVNVRAVSVASRPPLPIGVIALGGMNLSPGTSIRRVNTESGTVLAVSNGTYNINGSAQVSGDALYRGTAPSGTVTGSKIMMSANVACATVPMPTGVTPVSYSFSSNAYPVAGNFYASQVTLDGTAVLNLVGDTTIYCSGNINIGGTCVVNTGNYKLTIYMTSGAGVNLSNSNPLRAIIYAPQSPVNITAAGGVTGSIVCSTLNMSSGTVNYTSLLPIPVEPTGGGSALVPPIATVK